MMFQHKLDSNEFTFHLSRGSGSEIIFGGHDDSKIKGQWHYHNLAGPFSWSIFAEQIRVGDKDSGLCTQKKKCIIKVNTRYKLISGPYADLKKIFSILQIQPQCQNFRQIADITFVIDGVDYIITSEDYMLTYTQQGVEPLYVHSPDADIISCTSAIKYQDFSSTSTPYWALGSMFLTKYSAIFDRANERIGLGLSADYKQ